MGSSACDRILHRCARGVGVCVGRILYWCHGGMRRLDFTSVSEVGVYAEDRILH